MSFLYRPQRSSLAESMKQVVELKSKKCLAEKLNSDLSMDVDESQITIKPYTYDDRIDWNTHLVTVNGQGIGFTNQMV